VADVRKETDSLGEVSVPADKLWGAQTQRSLEHFSIGKDLIPREMITAYAILKKAAANANHDGKRLDDTAHKLIVQVCDEILAGQHHDMFPLHVWMTGSGTQFNMNVNEVISNRCCQLAGTPLGSKTPVHPNDHVNMSQSSNDTFPSAMYIAAAVNVTGRLVPSVRRCVTPSPSRPGNGRHRQDQPCPHAGRDAITLGQVSGYWACCRTTSND
jgi:fumarate hydratase class II